MTFELFCTGLLFLLFGLGVAFSGYRVFLVLLPIWGFFFGFGLGAQTLQVLFGIGFLATITSWLAGFFVGALFAVLSYLFYMGAVGVLAFSFGYGMSVAIFAAFGIDLGFLVWAVSVVVGFFMTVVVIGFNIQKYAVIAITAMGGAGIIVYTLLATFGNLSPEQLIANPVIVAIENSIWWLLFFVAMSIAGIMIQSTASQDYEVESYNRVAAV